METQGKEWIDGPPSSETPEDVAILYSWANLQGAKYRDFSANRREYRAQMRHRAAEQIRLQELKAQAAAEASAARAEADAAAAHAEADAAAARLAASRTISAALSGTPIDEEEAEHVRKSSLRAAAAQARKAAAERLEAARRAEAAAFAESNARREEREIAEAQAASVRQAAKYANNETRNRLAGPTPGIPGEISDPYSPQILAEGEYFERPGTPLSDLKSSRFKTQRDYIEKATGTKLPPFAGLPDGSNADTEADPTANLARRPDPAPGRTEDLSALFPEGKRNEPIGRDARDRDARDRDAKERGRDRVPLDVPSSDPVRDARLQDEFTARFEESRSQAPAPRETKRAADGGRMFERSARPGPYADPTFGAGQERHSSIPSIPYKEFRQSAASAQRSQAEVVRRIPDPSAAGTAPVAPPQARHEEHREGIRHARHGIRNLPLREPRIESHGDSRSIEIPNSRPVAGGIRDDRDRPWHAGLPHQGSQPRPPSQENILSGLHGHAPAAPSIPRPPRPRLGSDLWAISVTQAAERSEQPAPSSQDAASPPPRDSWSSQTPARPLTPSYGSVELSAPAWLYPKRQPDAAPAPDQRPNQRPNQRPENRPAQRTERAPARFAPVTPPRSIPAQSTVSPVGETLQESQEHVATRWYTLRGVFDQPQAAKPTHRQRAEDRDRPPNMLAVFSLAGGVGKTSLVATLGRGLSSLGERVLLTDTTSFGLLPYYYGANDLQPGAVRTFSPPSGSMDASIRMVGYELDHTESTRQAQDAVVDTLIRDSQGSNRVLIDLSGSISWLIECIAHLKPTVLVPLAADMNSVISLQAIEASFGRIVDGEGKPLQPIYLLNQFDAALPLHLDVREVLRQRLGDRLLPFAIRRANSVSEALAEGMTVVDYDPDSAVAQDYLSVAAWIRARSAPASKGFRNLRWSER
jgi:cellulose synthase operon protein YhjQ